MENEMDRRLYVVRCSRCGYTWLYKGLKTKVTCPRCRAKNSLWSTAVNIVDEEKISKVLEILGMKNTYPG